MTVGTEGTVGTVGTEGTGGRAGAAGALAQGTIEANGLTFGYLAAGDLADTGAPLALCLHGFPDSAWSWRHLLPTLAAEGYR
ncbi:MAG TPA: hypothetical protein VFI47_05100, partial [Acidimicrobiales bacterium]|nr:hypothetical protein [Acidimicrobiales bacterium]